MCLFLCLCLLGQPSKRHFGLDDLPLPDVGSEELLLAEDTAPDDIWVAFVKNCLSLFLGSKENGLFQSFSPNLVILLF